MKARFGSLASLLVVASCALRVKEQPATAVVENAAHPVTTAAGFVAETPPDAGARPRAEPARWDIPNSRLVYLRGDDLFVLETERFTVERKVQIPTLDLRELLLVSKGRALVFGSVPSTAGTNTMRKVVIIGNTGDVRVEELGSESTIALEIDPSDAILASAVIDEKNDMFVRLVARESNESGDRPRIELDVRPLGSTSKGTRTRTLLPPWFVGGMASGLPSLLGCRRTLCAFTVRKPSETAQNVEGLVAFIDLKTHVAKLTPVTVGPVAQSAFASNGLVAISPGGSADPILIDPKTWAVRSLGRLGTRFDPMQTAACIAFSSDGALLASASDDEPVTLFEVSRARRRWPSKFANCMTTNPSNCVVSVAGWRSCGIAFSEDDATVIDFSQLGSVQKLDAATGKLLNELRLARISDGPKRSVGNQSWHTNGELSPRASFFHVSDDDRGDTLLDVRTWKHLANLGYGGWSPNERFFISDERVWDVARGALVAILP